MNPIFGIHNHAEVRPVDEGCPICECIRAFEAENAALKAELAARPNYGTASNHSVWALQRDRIKELEARARAYERHLAEVHGCTCDEVDPDALEVLTKKETP